MFESTFVEDSI